MNHDHGQDNNSSNSIMKFVFIGFLLIAAYFLITEHKAHLSGFSIQSPKRGRRSPAAIFFPRKGSTVADFEITRRAFVSRTSVVALVEGFDLFPDRNYLVAAEPIVSGGVPWRVVMTAVRNDCVDKVEPWTTRLKVPWETGVFQSA